MLQKLFNAPWPDDKNILPSPAQQQAIREINGYWRSRGWQLVLGEIVLWAAAFRWHESQIKAYGFLAACIGLAYLLGFLPSRLTMIWLVGSVGLFMIQGMFISGLGAVTALYYMVPYTFAGMLLSERKRITVQAVCIVAFWFSLFYDLWPRFPPLEPPRYIAVSYNILLAAFTFQTLRFLNQLAVEVNTIHVAEEVRQQSQQFLMRISHELRTPLNSVLGFAKLLRRAPLTESQGDYLRLIIDEGEQLNRLVSDLLDSARLSTGKLQLNLAHCSLNAICEAVAEEQRPSIKEPVKLSVDLMPTLPPINGDAVRLRQALGNLVSNAIKHTTQGRIIVRSAQRGSTILISVSDTGPGIPEEQQKLIFVPFVQLDHRTPGVGLGLDIALQLVQLHGGTIQLQSIVGQGSTFTIELPIHPN
jgi:signal transduction histidine kinase